MGNEKAANSQQVLDWLKVRFQALKELGLTEIELEKFGVEFNIHQFVKLMSSFRQVPNLRQEIRKKIDVYTPSLLEILNNFIKEAMKKLPKNCSKKDLVVIVDNLDRIVQITNKETSRTNHEEIFLDRKNQMQGLHCHIIYTVPISMVYSRYGSNLADEYGQPVIMPMIMVKTKDNAIYTEGIDKLKEMVQRRLEKANVGISLENLVETKEALDEICQKSGGYVRNLMQLMQAAVKNSIKMPIPDRAVNRAISELREVYRKTIYGVIGKSWRKFG